MARKKRATAIVSIPYLSGAEVSNHIKRLALFFDEILCLPTTGATVKSEVLDDPNRTESRPDGVTIFTDFNYFKDTHRGLIFPLTSVSNEELRHMLLTFMDEGIVKELSLDELLHDEDQDHLNLVRDSLIAMDIEDEQFNRLSGTSPEDYDISKRIDSLKFQPIDGLSEFDIVVVYDPPAVDDSYDITTILYWADKSGGYPLFLDNRHRAEVQYRYA